MKDSGFSLKCIYTGSSAKGYHIYKDGEQLRVLARFYPTIFPNSFKFEGGVWEILGAENVNGFFNGIHWRIQFSNTEGAIVHMNCKLKEIVKVI